MWCQHLNTFYSSIYVCMLPTLYSRWDTAIKVRQVTFHICHNVYIYIQYVAVCLEIKQRHVRDICDVLLLPTMLIMAKYVNYITTTTLHHLEKTLLLLRTYDTHFYNFPLKIMFWTRISAKYSMKSTFSCRHFVDRLVLTRQPGYINSYLWGNTSLFCLTSSCSSVRSILY